MSLPSCPAAQCNLCVMPDLPFMTIVIVFEFLMHDLRVQILLKIVTVKYSYLNLKS